MVVKCGKPDSPKYSNKCMYKLCFKTNFFNAEKNKFTNFLSIEIDLC